MHDLLQNWKIIEQFVMWEYGDRHLKVSDLGIYHCCSFALNKETLCNHVHVSQCCATCTMCFQYFPIQVEAFICDIQTKFKYSEYRNKIDTMAAADPHFNAGLIQYTSHRLRAKIQFDCIRQIKDSMKNNPNTMLIVLDHKQKILSMKYREGQAEYFGKKGMSLLGCMTVQWIVKTNEDGTEIGRGFTYSFIDFIVDGYTGQDNTQVAGITKLIIEKISTQHPGITNVVFQSDNATCFASLEHIPYIFHLNLELKCRNIAVRRWVFTEAQTGRGRLDTHFSYLNVILKSFVQDGNDITIEKDIYKAITYRESIAGTTDILVDASKLKNPSIDKKFKTSTVRSRTTQDIVFENDCVKVQASSNISCPEIILKPKLQQHKKLDLRIDIKKRSTSLKPCLFINEIPNSVNLSNMERKSTKGLAYQDAMVEAGVERQEQNWYEHATAPSFCSLSQGWASAEGNSSSNFSPECMKTLHTLHLQGKRDKKHKVSADKAHRLLIQIIISADWKEQLNVTVANIKAFFQLTPAKMNQAIQKNDIPHKAIVQAQISESCEMLDLEAETLESS